LRQLAHLVLFFDHFFCAAAHCSFVQVSTFAAVEGGDEVVVGGADLGVAVDGCVWAKVGPDAKAAATTTAVRILK